MGKVSEKMTAREMRDFLHLEFDTSDKLSQFGGMLAFARYLEKARIKKRLEAFLDEKKARSVLQLALAIIAGAKDMEEVERVGKDPLIRKCLQGQCVGATQIARDFKDLSKLQLHEFHEFNISLAILDLCSSVKPGSSITLDVDATAVKKYGNQEGVELGYCGGDQDIFDCYQYQLFRIHELNSFLYGTIRGGSTHSQNDLIGYLTRLLPAFSTSSFKVKMRLDSGYFNEKLFDLAVSTKTFIYVKAPMSESRQRQAQASHLVWTEDPNSKDTFYASHTCYSKSDAIWREVFKKTIKMAKGSLFPEERVDCIATNDMRLDQAAIFAFYNGRANIENNIRELKNDYGLGDIVTQKFDANDGITQTIMMAYILIQHFKRIALDDDSQKIQLDTLRWRVFNIPGRFIKSGRRYWFRIVNAFAQSDFYQRIATRIRTTKSFLVAPPEIFASSA